ncbi:UvrD-helicase domain-containing protein [Candidatus Peregrinibacteria bacterium]|jgi:DNA helicase II / ATP-dependent DNA helicase PcrA|nr:UvrD-helicase domain-containing protein [Candidatus Peregrinibacteria bacterium]MBT4055531.1 UvrD-helicase domain-containing protein [Candidatus Peregrinibacteria bacterium]
MNQDLLENLNDKQKAAVMHNRGPLLIIAGAGTGKTRVITSKILHLIQNDKMKSSEILALTFTEKASAEMVERVDIQMPLGYEEVWIKTFHGFCDKVLRESGHEIGLDPNYKLLDKLQQWVFVKERLFDFDLKYFRPLGNPNSFINILTTHFGRIKEEFITPAEYVEYAKKMVAEVEAKKSLSAQEEIDVKSVLGVELEEAGKVLEAALAYQKYQELLLVENCMDFGDLSYYVLKLFEERPSVLAHYQERFKYILVDEFQDTNYAQFRLLLLLSGATDEGTSSPDVERNICVVGDDDQSIFRWRGASLSNILQFKKAFPDSEEIVLTENYRSNQNILDASHKFIKFNDPDRLEYKSGISKELKSQSQESIPIKTMHFAHYKEEVNFVIDEITKAVPSKEGLTHSDIAILVRSNAAAIPFAEALKKAGIPYYIRNPKGLMSYEEVKDLAAVVRALADSSDNIALMRLLQFPAFAIPMKDVVGLYNKAHSGHTDVFKIIEAGLDDETTLPGFEDSLTKFLDLYARTLEFSKNRGAGEVIDFFLRESGYLVELAREFSAESQEKLNNITAFSKIVWGFEQNATDHSVFDFAEYLKMIDESNIPLVEDKSDEMDNDAVKIITTHGAKGLEYDTVFVVNLVNYKFPILNKKDPLHVPLELTKEIFPEGDFHIEEERRLFYVACTRAKRRLVLTYSDKYQGARKWKKSQFLDEIGESGLVEEIDMGEQLEIGESSPVAPKAFDSPKIIDTAPRNALNRSLSYSQIDTFKMCPLKYGYRYLLHVPVPPIHAANFGTSLHETLKEFYRIMKEAPTSVSFDVMKELYERNWIATGYESLAHEDARKKQGLEMLAAFYEKNSDPWVIPEHIEKNFNLKIGEHMFTGRIDRIDKLPDGTFEVIDYKTSKSKALNVQHKLQMSIYALACRDIFGIPASKLSLYFLEDGVKTSMKKVPADLDSVRSDVLHYIEEIKASDFVPTPGFHCSFCDYRLICPAV